MAKNYSLKEVVQVIVENEDAAQLLEIGKRFPLLASKITRIAAKSGEELNDFMQFMPDNLSANKVNMSLKKSLEEDEVEVEDDDLEDDSFDAEEEVEEVSIKKSGKSVKASSMKKPKKESDEEVDLSDTDYDNWNNAKMYKFLGEIGKRKDCKEKMGGFSHDQMLKYLKKYGPVDITAKEVEEDKEAKEEVSYEGMTAPELFKLCKKRKITAETKKPAKYYIALLKKADEEEAQPEEDDEDWDEEEVEEVPVPKKNANKGASKPVAKTAGKGKGKVKQEKEEEDDEDWDI